MRDFGYSKSAQETLGIWGHDRALADVVAVIRSFQPDVVIARFDEDPPNHGHHTASAILAREAFAAAADPARFPEQLVDGVGPWQAARLFRNVSPWRGEPPPEALALEVGAYDPRLGVAYGELAARSRSQHRSQGFGVPGERGALVERFLWLAGSKPEKDVFEGIDLGWGRFGSGGLAFAKAIDEARAKLDRDHPERAIPALVAAAKALDALPDSPRARDARASLDRVLLAAAGLFVRAAAERPTAVPGGTVKVDVEVVLRGPVRATSEGAALARGVKKVLTRQVTIPETSPVSTLPYLESPPRHLAGAPTAPPALTVPLDVAIEDRPVHLVVPVVHAWTDPVEGERVRPFLVTPPATVTAVRDAVMLPNGKSGTVVLRVRAGKDGLRGDVVLPLPAGFRSAPESITVVLSKAGEETTVRFDVTAPEGAGAVEVRPAITVEGTAWSFRESTIDYPHIPLQLVLQPSRLRLVPLKIQVPDRLLGYVRGSGDTVADDLAHAGARVEQLDDEELRSGNLSRYAAIVVGIRAYNTREALRQANSRLLRYVEDGGTLVVQYSTNNRLSPVETPLGPYPFEIGRERITDETAALEPVDPKHPALHVPNEIVAADFEGWVQERGIYYAAKWDERYQPLFRSSDPGEAPLLGGAIVARHGKGVYVYTGLAFFRQLPAGVPGAYRLFANLVSLD
jgi:hypothetical protein